MDLEKLRNYCMAKKGVTEDFPFDESTLVFRVMNKMFCLTDAYSGATCNLKCDPERAIELRETYEEIIPGYHMSKKHWNTINLKGTLPDNFIKELIDTSYWLVVKSLPKKEQIKLD